MESMRILLSLSKSIFKKDIVANTTLTGLVRVDHFLFVFSIIPSKFRSFFFKPSSDLTFSIVLLSTVGIWNSESRDIRLIVSTSIPYGCGRMIEGGGGIVRTIFVYRNFSPLGSSKVIVA